MENLHTTHDELKDKNLIRLLCVDSFVSAKDTLYRQAELNRARTREINEQRRMSGQEDLIEISEIPTLDEILAASDKIFNFCYTKIKESDI
jgi:hypothetical protein